MTNIEKSTENKDEEYVTTVLQATTESSNIKKVSIKSKDSIGNVGQKLEIRLSNPQKTLKDVKKDT